MDREDAAVNLQPQMLSSSKRFGTLRASPFNRAVALLAYVLAPAVGVRPEVAVVGLAVMPPAVPAATPSIAPAAAQGNVVEVHMLTSADGASGHFKPAIVTVKKGDTVRFITDGRTVHNASFPPSENPGKSNLPASPGPYLTTPNQTYDLVVAMDPGAYIFQCDPHAPMGMKGVLTVK